MFDSAWWLLLPVMAPVATVLALAYWQVSRHQPTVGEELLRHDARYRRRR